MRDPACPRIRSADSARPGHVDSGCESAAARNARAASGAPWPRRTSTCASTCEQPSSAASRSAAANSYGDTARRASTAPRRLGAPQDGTGEDPGMETGSFPAGFFERAAPERPDEGGFDAAAVEALRDFYDDLGIDGRVLDLCAPSADHFNIPPDELIAGDCSAALPFPDTSFDDALCCEGLASLSQPLDTLAEVARVLRPGGH